MKWSLKNLMDYPFYAVAATWSDTTFIFTTPTNQTSWQWTSHNYYVCENKNSYYNKVHIW